MQHLAQGLAHGKRSINGSLTLLITVVMNTDSQSIPYGVSRQEKFNNPGKVNYPWELSTSCSSQTRTAQGLKMAECPQPASLPFLKINLMACGSQRAGIASVDKGASICLSSPLGWGQISNPNLT